MWYWGYIEKVELRYTILYWSIVPANAHTYVLYCMVLGFAFTKSRRTCLVPGSTSLYVASKSIHPDNNIVGIVFENPILRTPLIIVLDRTKTLLFAVTNKLCTIINWFRHFHVINKFIINSLYIIIIYLLSSSYIIF
jgi:hypothetical protein